MIDPLFKKTSADFDEGSASGLLLNHLNMAPDGRIIFDASDEILNDAAEGEEPTSEQINVQEVPKEFVDISKLKGMPFLGTIIQMIELIQFLS
jgi:condensin complex subunit 2